MRKPRVFLVEDHAPDVFLIEKALREYGMDCEVMRFMDGEHTVSALERLASDKDELPDLVVLDLNLPKLGGMEVLKSIRENPAMTKVRVMILTSSDVPRDRNEAWAVGADRFITKPSQLRAFITAVGQAARDLLAKTASSSL